MENGEMPAQKLGLPNFCGEHWFSKLCQASDAALRNDTRRFPWLGFPCWFWLLLLLRRREGAAGKDAGELAAAGRVGRGLVEAAGDARDVDARETAPLGDRRERVGVGLVHRVDSP